MSRVPLVLMILLLLVPAASGSGETTRTEQDSYVAGYLRVCNNQEYGGALLNDTFYQPVRETVPPYDGPGAGCFLLDGSESRVDITTADARAIPVPASYYMVGAHGEHLGHGRFCGTLEGLELPAGAVRLEVYVAPLDLFGICGADAAAGGSVGTVTAIFHL